MAKLYFSEDNAPLKIKTMFIHLSLCPCKTEAYSNIVIQTSLFWQNYTHPRIRSHRNHARSYTHTLTHTLTLYMYYANGHTGHTYAILLKHMKTPIYCSLLNIKPINKLHIHILTVW